MGAAELIAMADPVTAMKKHESSLFKCRQDPAGDTVLTVLFTEGVADKL